MNARSHRFILALLTSLAAAAILVLFIEDVSALGFVGWAIFFASLQYAYVFPEHGARCTTWLRRVGFGRED